MLIKKLSRILAISIAFVPSLEHQKQSGADESSKLLNSAAPKNCQKEPLNVGVKQMSQTLLLFSQN